MPEAAPGGRDDTAALIARIASSAASGVARRAFVLRLSQLPPRMARPHHLRLARAALDPLRGADRAESFDLANGDIALLWRGRAEGPLRAALAAVGELFAGDAATDPRALSCVLDLPAQADALLALARAGATAGGTPAAADTRPVLDEADLARLEAALAHADVARFARRRPVWSLAAERRARLAWEKRVLSVGEIVAELAPGRNCRGAPWLFRRLCATLERRMLVLLATPGELLRAGPFAIDLSVAGVLSRDFLRLDAALPAALRRRVLLELRAPDVLADPAAFTFARGFARARGYRLALHLADAALLDTLPAERLGVDLLRIDWTDRLAATDPERAGADPSRLVLGRADDPRALAWGRLHGVRLFQGMAVRPEPAGG